jgi:hypothetical protein
MISNLSKLFCIFLCIHQFSAQEVLREKLNGLKLEFETQNGRINGDFKAYAAISNNLFVEGKLLNGQRMGIWTIYDTLNPTKILIQRNYSSPKRFEQTIPKIENKLVAFVNLNLNKIPEFDSSGCRSYVYVTENDFIYGKRLFREISISENLHLHFNELNDLLKSKCSESRFWKYSNERFSEVLNENPFDKLSGKIVAYRMKEDFFFDKNQMISEFRPLGIAPIYKDSVTGELKELCWFYYPYLRKYLKDIKLNQKNNDYHFDDAIFDRDFSGIVYKTMESVRIEDQIEKNKFISDINCLMDEHKIWLFFAGQGGEKLY